MCATSIHSQPADHPPETTPEGTDVRPIHHAPARVGIHGTLRPLSADGRAECLAASNRSPPIGIGLNGARRPATHPEFR